jgi:organic hydroperoxide reductase OsmC/OhrA
VHLPDSGHTMKPFPHHYHARLSGGPVAYAELTAGEAPVLRMAPPPQFDGPGDAWSPEELFLAAVESCFLFTLRAVARMSQLEFSRLTLEASGIVDRQDRVTRFTEIALRAVLTVPRGTNRAAALTALEKTKSACLVSASISTPIRLEAEIQEAAAATPMRAAS